MNLVFAATLESISTRADGTLKIAIGTQEVDGDNAAKLFSFRNKYCKVLLSTEEISQAVKEAVIKEPVDNTSKRRTPSQITRFNLMRLHEKLNTSQDFESFYNYEMAKYNSEIESRIQEII